MLKIQRDLGWFLLKKKCFFKHESWYSSGLSASGMERGAACAPPGSECRVRCQRALASPVQCPEVLSPKLQPPAAVREGGGVGSKCPARCKTALPSLETRIRARSRRRRAWHWSPTQERAAQRPSAPLPLTRKNASCSVARRRAYCLCPPIGSAVPLPASVPPVST